LGRFDSRIGERATHCGGRGRRARGVAVDADRFEALGARQPDGLVRSLGRGAIGVGVGAWREAAIRKQQ
jgi:hypothetical protein